MFYEKVIEIIVLLLADLKNNKQLGETEVRKLTKLGYSQNEINTAFSWIYSKIQVDDKIFESKSSTRSHRFLHEVEKNVISSEAFGYLIQLRELGMISDIDIEVLIERIMSSGYSKVNVDDMKYFLAGYLLDSEESSGSNKHFMLDINDSVN